MNTAGRMAHKDGLLIIGAGGHGKVVADIALKIGKWRRVAFLDDDESITCSMGIEVVGKSSEAIRYLEDHDILVAVGNNKTRERLQKHLLSLGASIPILVHPRAVIADSVEVGAGTVVMAGVVINSCTTIGEGCIVNTGSTIDHDNIVEEYVHISPGVHTGGTVHIGRGVWVGIGATILNNISITPQTVVGAGAVVVRDIVDAGKYIGIPARKLE